VVRATRLVCRRATRIGDGVRHSTVEVLVAAGFTVEPTPTRMIPDHATVSRSGVWDAEVAASFDACFGDPEWS
jgi:hypothetical protein